MTQLSLAPVGVSLRALLGDGVCGAAAPNLRVTSCTSDWRNVRPGDLFVALAEADDDGHDHVVDAARKGAAAMICERPVPVFDVPQVVVQDSRIAYGKLCQALVGNPSQQLNVIGVTGTHGKTTVARLLASIFRTVGGLVGTLDSFGYWDGIEDRPASGQPLCAPTLARSLADMNAVGATHAIIEASSRELASQVFAGITLDAVCMTQVGRNHISWHGSVKNYRQAKRRIVEYLDGDGFAILNADDPLSVEILSELNHPALTYGMRLPAEITANVIEQHINEQLFVLSAGNDSVGVRTEMIGDHHVYNCLAAAAMALTYGIDLPAIARGLEAVEKLPGRMERVMCGQDYAVLVDAADSPDALCECFRAARTSTTGRLICVFGTHDGCDQAALPAIGRVLGAMTDVAFVTSQGAGDHSHRACMELRSGFAEPRRARVVIDRGEAIRTALDEARSGDTVVIAGMGERPHTPDADGLYLNDYEMVRRALHGSLTTTQPRSAA